MKLNWKARFKNGPWLASFLSTIVAFVYQILAMLEVAPTITQNNVLRVIDLVLMLLGALGVIADPTTSSLLYDSTRALGYKEPAPNCMESEEVG